MTVQTLELNPYYQSDEILEANGYSPITPIERKYIKAKEDGSIRTPEFWKNIALYPGIDKTVLVEKLELMIPVMDRIFPGKWDIHCEIKDCFLIPSFLFYFPEVTITNSKNPEENKLLKKLVLQLSLNIREDIISTNFTHEIKGTRLHFDYLEFTRGYVHSHLNARNSDTNPFIINTFCLGSSEIREVFAILDETNYIEEPEKWEGYFELLLEMFISHAETESEEGGTYFNIRQITPLSDIFYRRMDLLEAQHFYRDLITIIKSKYEHQEGFKLEMDIVFDGRGFFIKENKKFVEFISSILIEQGYYRPLVTVNSIGQEFEYVAEGEVTFVDLQLESFATFGVPFTIIHGEKIYLEVDKCDKEIHYDIKEYRISKQFLDYVKKGIEEQINKNAIRKYTIDKFNEQYSTQVVC